MTEKDLSALPEPVKKHLKYVGVVGKEKVKNMKVIIGGSMKTNRERDWTDVKVAQYSFLATLPGYSF